MKTSSPFPQAVGTSVDELRQKLPLTTRTRETRSSLGTLGGMKFITMSQRYRRPPPLNPAGRAAPSHQQSAAPRSRTAGLTGADGAQLGSPALLARNEVAPWGYEAVWTETET
ncbi:hypothetical protein EYF80_048833 [Liparis tanakae]|uniref:Uncharacterized protein n=1 Tax=Liparis tanakae TaxID=230148 RepID=A0A4Z2FIF2_9TELE|nr:hypothetical protein EYF80_048833 [Liparis tanakae]